MPETLCTRCGAPLEAGACPNGHPQRAERTRPRRRVWPAALTLVGIVILIAGAYGALVWYPERQAATIIRPASRDFAAALQSLEATIDALPAGGSLDSLADAPALLAGADDTRGRIGEAQLALADSPPAEIPFISGREPLALALDTRARIERFYPDALDLVGDLEAAARYLSDLAPTLPNLENLRTALEGPRTRPGIAQAVAAARPVAEQILADLGSLSPPAELSATHASLEAIARGLRTSIDELERLGAQGPSPLVAALVEDIGSQVGSFATAAGLAPGDARAAGLDERIAEVRQRAERITGNLRALADSVGGVSVPGA